MKKIKDSASSDKVTFGRRKIGKHSKQKNVRDKSVSVYKGQGRS